MKRDLGKKIWIYTGFIVVMGLIALYSASYANVRVPQKVFYDQLFCAIAGFGIMYLLGKVDYRKFYDAAYSTSSILSCLLLSFWVGDLLLEQHVGWRLEG